MPDLSGVTFEIIPTSHLDLFWLGDYRNCLRRGDEIIRAYLDRARESDETFVIDTAIFAEHFVRTHPQYEEAIKTLAQQGRLEIGAAYIDRWENLVLGESLIRNIQIGRRWLSERLGIDGRLAAHPDLPGLNAQTSQIYSQAGIDYYVTSRKIFHEGRVWRHRAPDGTPLLMLTWPVHYNFTPLEGFALDESATMTFTEHRRVSLDGLAERYPHQSVALPGSAGDLTGPSDFVDRYGKDLRDYVSDYRAALPDGRFGYTTPSRFLEPYVSESTPVAEVRGSLPSVWGVAPDEESRFFLRVREIEHLLLSAETASVVATRRGLDPLPPSAAQWRGLFAEDAFFASDDHPPVGREWEWLWRMHAFTQDHNGGGQDGPLSVFQKKVRHDRARGYASEVIEHATGATGGDPSILHTRLGRSVRLLRLDDAAASELKGWLGTQDSELWQPIIGPHGAATVAVSTAEVSGVGVRPLRLERAVAGPVGAHQDESHIFAETDELRLAVSRATGSATLSCVRTGEVWELATDGLLAVRELGNDVTLATDEAARATATVESATIRSVGPLAAQIELVERLLDVEWRILLTLWADEPRLDVDVRVQWPGLENWQVRLPLVGPVVRDDIAHGTAFHGSAWTDVDPRAGTMMPDEVTQADFESYREIQHWMHVRGRHEGLVITTSHPGVHHDGSLHAVLLRTAPSCGERRMHWDNAGANCWSFTFRPAEASWMQSRAPEIGDRDWRTPQIQAHGLPETVELLTNDGDDVVLSACAGQGDATMIRLVNQSDQSATVQLKGAAVIGSGELVDLAGNRQALTLVDGASLVVELPAWRIQTVLLRDR